MSIVTKDEISNAHYLWNKVYCPPRHPMGKMCPMWRQFLGAGPFDGDNGKFKVNEEAARKIRLINGPHGETLLKACYSTAHITRRYSKH